MQEVAYTITLKGLINDDEVYKRIVKYMRKFKQNAIMFHPKEKVLVFRRIELVS